MQLKDSLRTVTPIGRVLLLCVVILAQDFLSRDLLSSLLVVVGFLVWLIDYGRIKRSYLRLVWPLMGVFLIGIVGAPGHESHDILRDIAFALVPLALIYIGYWLAGDAGMWPLILRVMMVCGFVQAAIHLSTFAINPGLLNADVENVRQAAGVGGALVTISLVLGLFSNRLGMGRLFPKVLPRFIFITVLLASFVLSYSRTEIAIAIVLALSLWGTLSRIDLRLVLAVVVFASGFVATIATVPEGETGSLRSKLAKSVTEIAVSNYEDMADINNNWRGFETYRALQSFSSGSVVQQIFGKGFGTLVDIGFVMDFGEVAGVQLRYIPILHNGYAYILIKAGILGAFLYAFFYIKIIRQGMRYSASAYIEERFLARLLLGCIWCLVIVMFIIGGMAQTAEPALVLLLGYLLRRMELLRVARQEGCGQDKVLVAL